jgi:hypothetical protein
MRQAFQKIAKSALTLEPEERLALTAALDLSLDDEVRAGALREAVQVGLAAIESGDSVSVDSKEDLETRLNECLAEAKKQVHMEMKCSRFHTSEA